MSQNLDLVCSIYTAWERGNYSSGEWQHAEIEFVIADGPTPGAWTVIVMRGSCTPAGRWRTPARSMTTPNHNCSQK